MGLSDKIADIEREMSKTQKNKATEHHLGILKAKLAKLKSDLSSPKGPSVKGKGWEVSRSGDARTCLIGFPSVGKSTFLSLVTGTFSKQAEHEFTTVDCITGTMDYKGASIQILDLPGIIAGAASNKGRGRQILSTAKTSDLIIMMLDHKRPHDVDVLTRELNKMGIRLNRKKPDMTLTIAGKGIDISSTVKLSKISEKTINGILKAYKIHNCQLTIREDITSDDLIDLLSGQAAYIPCVYCYNKTDELTLDELYDLPDEATGITCTKKWNIDGFKEEIWNKLGFIRLYSKKREERKNFDKTFIFYAGATVKDLW